MRGMDHKLVWLGLIPCALSGCFRIDGNTHVNPDGGVLSLGCGGDLQLPAAPPGAAGSLGRLRFTWNSAEARPLSAPLALGATMHVTGTPVGAFVLVATVDSSDPVVAAIACRSS